MVNLLLDKMDTGTRKKAAVGNGLSRREDYARTKFPYDRDDVRVSGVYNGLIETTVDKMMAINATKCAGML